jgi:hypothetical protein
MTERERGKREGQRVEMMLSAADRSMIKRERGKR